MRANAKIPEPVYLTEEEIEEKAREYLDHVNRMMVDAGYNSPPSWLDSTEKRRETIRHYIVTTESERIQSLR